MQDCVYAANLAKEDHDVSPWSSLNFFSGPESLFTMHTNLVEPCPADEKHPGATEREVGNGTAVLNGQRMLAEGEFAMDGWRLIF